MVVVSAPLILCYETMAIFGLVLVAACMYRWLVIAKSPREKWLTMVLGIWYSLGVIFALLAIIFPRDPTQRADFLQGNRCSYFIIGILGRESRGSSLILCALIVLLPAIYKKTLDLLVGASHRLLVGDSSFHPGFIRN